MMGWLSSCYNMKINNMYIYGVIIADNETDTPELKDGEKGVTFVISMATHVQLLVDVNELVLSFHCSPLVRVADTPVSTSLTSFSSFLNKVKVIDPLLTGPERRKQFRFVRVIPDSRTVHTTSNEDPS